MTISVITVCFNSEETIGKTLKSVREQNNLGFNIEHIVVDGNSTDKTLQIIQEYSDVVSICISEPDNGIYDAMNKGWAVSSGDVVGFLNSDDYFASPDVLGRCVEVLSSESAPDIVYGDIDYVDREDRIVRKWRSGVQRPFRQGWHPPHPAFYAKRKTFDIAGGFDESFKIAADFDLMLRFMDVRNFSAAYIPAVMVKMRTGGASNSGWRSTISHAKELRSSFQKYDISPRAGYIYLRWMSKLLQHLR